MVMLAGDFDQAFTDPNKTEIAAKILEYAKAVTGRDVPLQFQAVINYRIKVCVCVCVCVCVFV